MIDLSFPTVKLGQHIRKINTRVKDSEMDSSEVIVYGVTNTEGIAVTGQKISDDIGNYILLQNNQFAFNPYRINVGSLGLFRGDNIGAVSPAYVVFEALQSYDSDFLLFYLKSPLGIKLIKWYGDRGGVRAALRFDDLCNIDVPDISVENQRIFMQNFSVIKTNLNEYNRQLDKQTRYITKLRQSILHQAVEGKLCPQDPNDEPASELLNDILEINDAKTEKIKKSIISDVSIQGNRLFVKSEWICDFITKGTTPPTSELKDEGEIPFLKVYNIVNNKINFEYRKQFISEEIHNSILSRSKVYPNDVLINIVGPPLGKVAIVPCDYIEWNVNQAIAIFRPLKVINSDYLYYVLLEGSEIKRIATVGTVGQENISLQQCREIIVPVPSLSEQKRIVEKLNSIMSYCDELEKQVSKSKEYAENLMQSILTKAFNDQKEKQPAVIVVMPHQVETQPVKLAARGSISVETMQHIEQTINEMCGDA